MSQYAVRDKVPSSSRRTVSDAMQQIFHIDPQADAAAWLETAPQSLMSSGKRQLLRFSHRQIYCEAFRPVWNQRVILSVDCVLQCGDDLVLLPLAMIYRLNLLPGQASCTLCDIVPADSPLADPGPDACGDDLLPRLTADSARRAADEILAAFLPGTTHVQDPSLLASILGLRVIYLRLAPTIPELGFFSFGNCIVPLQEADGQVRRCRVPAGSVVVNLQQCPPQEIRATALHELCHWFLECPSRLLNQLFASPGGITLPLEEMEHSAELLRMCLQGHQATDETCTISPADALELMRRDPSFAALVHSGRYIYTSGMFCSSAPDLYLPDGTLSHEVFQHPAACCLRFRRYPDAA